MAQRVIAKLSGEELAGFQRQMEAVTRAQRTLDDEKVLLQALTIQIQRSHGLVGTFTVSLETGDISAEGFPGFGSGSGSGDRPPGVYNPPVALFTDSPNGAEKGS